MAITHSAAITGVDHSADPPTVSTLSTGTFTSTAGEMCIVVASVYGGSPGSATWHSTTPIQDSKSNTWTQIGSEVVSAAAGHQRTRAYWAILTSAGASHTITMNASANAEMVLVAERFAGTATSSPVDISSTLDKTVSSTAWTATGIATGNAGDLVIGWVVDDNSRALTATSPQTKGSFLEGGGWYGAAISYDIKSSTGTYSPAFTTAVGDTGVIGAIAILPAATAVAPTVNDAVTLTESTTTNVVRCPQPNDSTTISESVTVNVVRCPQVNDAVTVADAQTLDMLVFPQSNDAVSLTESVTVRFGVVAITVSDDVGLSKLVQPNETVTLSESVSATIAAASTRLVSLGEDIIAHDDGQGVALQGGVGALILVSVLDNVGLSKLVPVSETVTITDFVAVSAVFPGSAVGISTSDAVTLTDQVIVIPDDYIFVTESVSVYFRTINAIANDAVTLTELVTLLLQGGSPGAPVQLNVSDGLTVSESFTTGIPVTPTGLYLVSVTESVLAMVPLQPQPFDSVTIVEAVPVLIGKLLMPIGEEVTLTESVEVRFSRLLINLGEDIGSMDAVDMSRPSQPWEGGAVTIGTWDSIASGSGVWQPGAVEDTVWV